MSSKHDTTRTEQSMTTSKHAKVTSNLRTTAKYIILFIAMIAAELGLLTIAASLPPDAIQTHMEESARYLSAQRMFPYLSDKDKSSRMDYYADSILYNIAYSYDSSSPLYSVLASNYYYIDTQNENLNLLDAVTKGKQANHSYARYWHGGAGVIRILSLCLNLEQICIFHCISLGGLLVWLCYMLTKHRKHLLLPVVISLASVSLWYVPLCLEYTWNVILLFVACIGTLILYQKKQAWIAPFYFIMGSLTAYMDFLTTETLVCLYPIVLLLAMRYEDETCSTEVKFKHCLATAFLHILPWGIGYAATWAGKWLLASIATGSNVITDAITQSAYRIAGDSNQAEGIAQIIGAPLRNMQCLFPISFLEKHGQFVFLGTLLLIWIVYYILDKKREGQGLACTLLLLGSLPYVRYMVLANHSYMHYFFTYRTQAVTILCICLIVYYRINWDGLKKKMRSRSRNKKHK